MKNIYNNYKSHKAVNGLLRISAIIIMTMVWILIDKGNIYGQSLSEKSQLSKQALEQSSNSQTPLFKDGDESRDGDLPIDDDEDNEFVVKPNPVEGDLVFDFEFTVKTSIPVEIYNPLGKLVGTGVFEPGISSQKLDFSHFPTGMYIVRLNIGGKAEVRRVIKK
ncbi:MAG: T9SS type A sorting domain-containing protein [Flavobacteriales bacterium]|nr:T9SS type A sorting domain-containing protein [Flavobacteriales bacterium]